MKMKKEDLVELLKGQVSEIVKGNEFADMIQTAMKDYIAQLQKDVQTPFRGVESRQMLENLPFAKIDGKYMSTKQGSILNLEAKNNPWIQASEEMTEWAKDFATYLKTNTVSKLMAEGVDADGGYLVPEEFRALMIQYDAEPTIVWSRATVWPMSGTKLSFPKLMQNPEVSDNGFDHFAGVSFDWVEEGGEKPSTQPEFGLIEMIVHELAGYTEITNTLLDDSVINLLNYLTSMFRAAWYWYTDKDFLQGTGGKRPLGIINDPSVLTVARETASQVTVADVLNLDAKLPSVFDSSAVWFITKLGRASLRGQTVTSSSKQLVLQESYSDIKQGYDMTILGKPAVLADGKCPALGSTGDVILGAWNQYYIGFREDFAMDSSRHAQFRKNRTALRCSGRVDGQAAIPEAFVLLDDAS